VSWLPLTSLVFTLADDDPIAPWAVPARGPAGARVDAPLLPRSKLTLGYGNGGATPWEFVFVGQGAPSTEDVGFFKRLAIHVCGK
jgi:hypothetical protein